MIRKVLIANRGEIAVRIIRACREMGILTVAVYSEADREALHAQLADEAVCIGPAPSKDSYLNMERILSAALVTGADAVHPGFGFLSENSTFARRCQECHITWIGPSPEVMDRLGNKSEARNTMQAAGVPVIPGTKEPVFDWETGLSEADRIGFPVMIKAALGGGGKGMRIAWNDKEALTGYHLSKQEAKSAFGDDRMFIEKYIEEPRHIEIQVLGDKYGNYCAFPERECSIQRRNQKVVEESPSCLLDEETRTAMGKQACMMAKAVNYCSAGTVEFLCDKHKNFYFLEMNTRLQVEHPITEMVTREDLVEQMFWIAAGKKLPDRLINWPLKRYAHAIETRVYAEDPRRNFLPSLGLLTKYIEPTGEGVRCDSGILDGSQISMYYDPMICKLVTWGDDRATAIKRMDDALNTYIIRGLNHNSAFLQSVIRSKRFASGKITTNFIKEEYPNGWTNSELTEKEAEQLIAATVAVHQERLATQATNDQMMESYKPAFEQELVATVDKKSYKIHLEYEGDAMMMTIDGKKVKVENAGLEKERPIVDAKVNGEDVKVQYFEPTTEGYNMQYCGGNFNVILRSARAEELSKFMIPKVKPDTSKFLASPMAGSLVKVHVKEGDRIEAGQALAVVEAMKMQNELYAQKTCVVKKIYFKPGQNLALDDVIMDFDTTA